MEVDGPNYNEEASCHWIDVSRTENVKRSVERAKGLVCVVSANGNIFVTSLSSAPRGRRGTRFFYFLDIVTDSTSRRQRSSTILYSKQTQQARDAVHSKFLSSSLFLILRSNVIV